MLSTQTGKYSWLSKKTDINLNSCTSYLSVKFEQLNFFILLAPSSSVDQWFFLRNNTKALSPKLNPKKTVQRMPIIIADDFTHLTRA